MGYVRIEEDADFSKEFETYIIAFCPDYDFWFATNQRYFYYEYPKEFQTENEAIEYFVNNPNIFYEKEIEMEVYRPSFNENGVFLENIRKLIEVQGIAKKPRKTKKPRVGHCSDHTTSNKEDNDNNYVDNDISHELKPLYF